MFQRVMAMDDERRRENQARLRQLLATTSDVRVHSAHDAAEYERFAENDPAKGTGTGADSATAAHP
jgi:hypothetical protein